MRLLILHDKEIFMTHFTRNTALFSRIFLPALISVVILQGCTAPVGRSVKNMSMTDLNSSSSTSPPKVESPSFSNGPIDDNSNKYSKFFRSKEYYVGKYKCNKEIKGIMLIPYYVGEGKISIWVSLDADTNDIEYIADGFYDEKKSQYKFFPKKILKRKDFVEWRYKENFTLDHLRNPPGSPLPKKTSKILQPLEFSGTFEDESDKVFMGDINHPQCGKFYIQQYAVWKNRIDAENKNTESTPSSGASKRVTIDLASIKKSAGLVPSFHIVYGGDHLYAAFGTHGAVYVRGITNDYSGVVGLRQCRSNNLAGCLEVLVPGVKLKDTGVGWDGKSAGEVSSPTSRYEFSYKNHKNGKYVDVNYTSRQDKVTAHQQMRKNFLENYRIQVRGSSQSADRAIKDSGLLASYAGSCRDMVRKVSITPVNGNNSKPVKITVRWTLQRTYDPLHLEEKGDPVHKESVYILNANNKYTAHDEIKYQCIPTALRVHHAGFSLLGIMGGVSKEKMGFNTTLTGTKFGFDVLDVRSE